MLESHSGDYIDDDAGSPTVIKCMVRDGDQRRGCACLGAGDTWEFSSVPLVQLCYESKNCSKKKIHFFNHSISYEKCIGRFTILFICF